MKKSLIIGAVVIAILIAVYLWWKHRENAEEITSNDSTKQEKTNKKGKTASAPIPQRPSGEKFPYKYGDKDDMILYIQRMLNSIYKTNLVEDGIYGPKTQEAISSKLGINQISTPADMTAILSKLPV